MANTTKADLEGELQNHKDAKAEATKELGATNEYIAGLHGECDWLSPTRALTNQSLSLLTERVARSLVR